MKKFNKEDNLNDGKYKGRQIAEIDKINDAINLKSVIGENNRTEQFIEFEIHPKIRSNEYLPSIVKAIQEEKKVQFSYNTLYTKSYITRIVSPLFFKGV